MIKIISLLIVVCALLQHEFVLASDREFLCSPAFSEMEKEYPKLVCAGNDLMERGRPKEALALYRKAAAVEFFESPNFLIYFRIAWAEAAVGNKDSARSHLKDLEDMLAIYAGERACQDESAQVSERAIEVMCQPIYGENSYRSKVGLIFRRAIARDYRARIRVIISRYKISL